ncbi:MAG TPA: T9SS type A sorting domain-containing protein [Panacibacter sp.]|nr:T9SS type A sorting domain-containing protein [Panacibacter sp.]
MKKISFNNMKKRLIKVVLMTTIFNLFLAVNANAQPGTLDSSFGMNGIVPVTGFEIASATALQADGKIIVGGEITDRFFVVSRFNSDGSIDESFGDEGIVKTNIYSTHGFYMLQSTSIAVQKDGKILIGGTGYYPGHTTGDDQFNFLILRYNTDGSLDENFGDRGAVISDFQLHGDYIQNIVLQPDGKILAAGQSGVDVLLARYNTDGSFDESFGNGNGWLRQIFAGVAVCRGLSLQPDGKIVLLAAEQDNYSYLLRYKTDGTKDSSFGENGKIATNAVDHEQLQDVIVQGDGKILAAGYSYKNDIGTNVGLLFRYNQNGSYDTSFGEGGKVINRIDTGRFSINHVLIQPDKQIITTGSYSLRNDITNYTGSVIKYNKDGSYNQHFGINAMVLTTKGNAKDAALLQDGKMIILEGKFGVYFLSRYKGEPITDPQFAKIKRWLHKHGFTWDDFPHLAPGGSIHVERSSNGNIFTTIASIIPHNNNQSYSFEDPAPLAGTNYYRLTAVAGDGSNVSSNVIAIGSSDAASVKIYPNPVKNSLQVTGLSATQKTTLSITDLSGAVRAAVTMTGSSYNWYIGQLKAGSYILRIENGGRVVSKMFVKE